MKIRKSCEIFIYLIGLSLFLMSMASCNKNEGKGAGISILPNQEFFVVPKEESNEEDKRIDSEEETKGVKVDNPFELTQKRKIDLIWVVDNSTSMSSHQKNLKENARYFFNLFKSYKYDFRIAVITTDMYKSERRQDFRDRTGTVFHTAYKNIPFITLNTPKLEKIFMENIMVSTNLSNDERGMESLMAVLETKEGQGFLRDDAFLSLIFVSDEDDGSLRLGGDSNFTQKEKSQIYLDHYLPLLKEIKGSREDSKPQGVSISAIVVNGKECKNELNNGVGIGFLYMDLVKATSGVVNSLCNKTFDKVMKESAQSIVSRSLYFKLKRNPDPSTLAVFIDGVQKARGIDWVYNVDENSVFFHPQAIPDVGAEVQINYIPIDIAL